MPSKKSSINLRSQIDNSMQGYLAGNAICVVSIALILTGFATSALALSVHRNAFQSQSAGIAQSSVEDATRYHNDRGLELLRDSQFQEAIKEFSRVIELDPYYAQAYLWRGIAHRRAGDYQASIQDISTQIQVDPFSAAYYERGLTYLALGETQKAFDDFNQAISEGSRDYEWIADSYRQRGLIRKELGDRSGAIEDFQEAQEIYSRLRLTSTPEYESLLRELGLLEQ